MLRRLVCTVALALAFVGTAAHAQSTVQLLDAGAAPREALRYRFTAGRTEHAALDTSMSMTLSMAGTQLPMSPVPPTRMVMEMRPAEVAADGSARVEFKLLKAEAAAGSAASEQMNQQLAGVAGVSGFYRLSPQGITSDGDLTNTGPAASAAAAVLADFRQSIQQLGAPFPTEALGTGARWQVRQEAETGGMKVSQTVEFTLRSREGRRVTLDVRIADAKVDPGAALPPGAQLGAINMKGSGTMVLDLDRLVPTSTMDIAIGLAMSMSAQQQTQSMAIDMAIKQAMAPTTAPTP